MRKMLAVGTVGAVVTAVMLVAQAAAPSASDVKSMLKTGNQRFVSGEMKHPHQTQDRRHNTATKGQKPFVTVVGCADSRVPVEQVFDQGVGDIFTIRVAGNVCDTTEIASVEYAVATLETPMIVVLGHTHCGAVGATAMNQDVPGHLKELVAMIKPAVTAARAEDPSLSGDALVAKSIEKNVWLQIEELLEESEVVRDAAKNGKVQIVGAIYDIETGKVNMLGAHPKQNSIIHEEDAVGTY
jgi:carbonic anhydrase